MQVTVVANFDVVAQTRTISFQTTGTWFNYVANGTGNGINGATAIHLILPQLHKAYITTRRIPCLYLPAI
jgi:hypothetical protein